MKNPLKNILFGFLVPFSDFLPDQMLKEANVDYFEQRYEDAYKKYASYMFNFGKIDASENRSSADYYIALMGKSRCMLQLNTSEMFIIENALFSEMMNSDLSESEKILLGDILDHSVYWDLYE